VHLEKVVVRVSASSMAAACVAFAFWLSSGQDAWRLVATGAYLLAALTACTPLLLLAVSRLFCEARRALGM
jgi:hypothetical protein